MSKLIQIDRIYEIIDKELRFAKEVNPQMAFGMLQIKEILQNEEMIDEEDTVTITKDEYVELIELEIESWERIEEDKCDE